MKKRNDAVRYSAGELGDCRTSPVVELLVGEGEPQCNKLFASQNEQRRCGEVGGRSGMATVMPD